MIELSVFGGDDCPAAPSLAWKKLQNRWRRKITSLTFYINGNITDQKCELLMFKCFTGTQSASVK